MPRRPLLPLLRFGSAVGIGTLLLYPDRTAVQPAAKAPEVWVTDMGQDASRSVNLPPPAKPFERQLTECRPRVHALINGGCWRRLADGPPCEEAYLWEGACYLPVMKAERPSTSVGE